MKKILSVILIIMLVSSMFSGCTQKDSKSGKGTPTVTDTPGSTATDNKVVPGEYVGFDGIDPNIEAEVTMYRYYADADKVYMDAAIENTPILQ